MFLENIWRLQNNVITVVINQW